VFKISPSFRIIAIGNSESDQTNSTNWMNDQIMSLFMFHMHKQMGIGERQKIVNKIVPNVSPKISQKLLQLVEILHSSSDAGVGWCNDY
jgi:hypothetical protein